MLDDATFPAISLHYLFQFSVPPTLRYVAMLSYLREYSGEVVRIAILLTFGRARETKLRLEFQSVQFL